MRLISCYVENFGGLHQFSYTFTEGLNVIHQQNGWGKTTFAVFIKAMLYGLEYSPRKKLEDNERKKYMPWQGGAFGGNLVFETEGKRYRAERFFGARDKDDTFRLYDVETGLESEDFSERLGEELFHVDGASYGKSTYIPQNSTQAGVTDHLRARLGNIIENANDMERSTEAITFLTERQKEYRRTGKRGKIYEAESRISELEHSIAACDSKETAILQLEQQIAETKERRNELLEQREHLEQQVAEEVALELKRQELRAKEESLGQLEQQIQQNQAVQAQLQRSWDREIREQELEKKQRQRQWKIAGIILIAAGILMQLLIANGILTARWMFGAGVCVVIGVLVLIFGFRRGITQKSEKRESGSRKRCQYLDELQQEIQASKDAQMELQRKLASYQAKIKELHQQEEELAALISLLPSSDRTVPKLEQMQEQRRELDERIRVLERNMVEYRRDADACTAVLDERQDLEAELAKCREQKEQMQENYHILQQTVKWLQKAKEQFASYYMGPLAEGFQKYARIICGEDADEIGNMQMDIALDVRMEAGGVLREKEYFSVGYRDFIGVCTRLALTDALFGEEKPFLILDDPFVNLDDEKMKRAGKLLRELADTYQVIYLVCHSSRN